MWAGTTVRVELDVDCASPLPEVTARRSAGRGPGTAVGVAQPECLEGEFDPAGLRVVRVEVDDDEDRVSDPSSAVLL